MYQNARYHAQTNATTVDFLRARSFGTLVVNGPDGMHAMQAPFVVTDDDAALDMHIVRSNPIVKALSAPCPALMVVNGPDGYISPDWYGPGDYVSTWNYVAVQVHGSLALSPQPDLTDLLIRQTATYEERLAPKPPWTMDKVPAAKIEVMKRAIHPMRLSIARIEPTWKLGQDKPEAARLGAADRLNDSFGHNLAELSALMRAGGPSGED